MTIVWIELYTPEGFLLGEWFARINHDQAREISQMLHRAVEEGLVAKYDVGPTTHRHPRVVQVILLELNYDSLIRDLVGFLAILRASATQRKSRGSVNCSGDLPSRSVARSRAPRSGRPLGEPG